MPHDPNSVTISRRMYETLLGAAARDMAAEFIRSYRMSAERGGKPDDVPVHPGDPLGKVVAELWQRDHESAYMFLADYMASVRSWGQETLDDMPFSLVLKGLTTFAWPNWASEEEADELRRSAPDRVQAYYGDTWLG